MRPLRVPPLWRSRDFRLLWGGQTASIFGDRVTDIALPSLILAQTGQPFVAGAIGALRYIPSLVLGLVAGVLADRWERRWLLVACDLGRALALCAVVAVGIMRQSVPLWLVALVVLALGLGQLGFGAAYYAWLPDVTSEALLPNATAALEASDALSTVTGPALGGAIISLAGPAIALGVDALSYLASGTAIWSVRSPTTRLSEHRHVDARSEDLWAEALAGLRFILGSPEQRLLYGVGAALSCGTGAITTLLTVLTEQWLRLPAWQAGIVFGMAGIGGLIGSIAAPHILALGWRHALSRTLAVAACGWTGLIVSTVLRQPGASFFIACAANLVLDGAVALSFIITGTTSTLLTPAPVRGRVNAVSTIFSAAVRGGFLVAAGALAAQRNPLAAFSVLLAIFLAAAISLARPQCG